MLLKRMLNGNEEGSADGCVGFPRVALFQRVWGMNHGIRERARAKMRKLAAHASNAAEAGKRAEKDLTRTTETIMPHLKTQTPTICRTTRMCATVFSLASFRTTQTPTLRTPHNSLQYHNSASPISRVVLHCDGERLLQLICEERESR